MTTANRPPPLDAFREDRTYLGADHLRNERRTWLVAGIYALTLVRPAEAEAIATANVLAA